MNVYSVENKKETIELIVVKIRELTLLKAVITKAFSKLDINNTEAYLEACAKFNYRIETINKSLENLSAIKNRLTQAV